MAKTFSPLMDILTTAITASVCHIWDNHAAIVKLTREVAPDSINMSDSEILWAVLRKQAADNINIWSTMIMANAGMLSDFNELHKFILDVDRERKEAAIKVKRGLI